MMIAHSINAQGKRHDLVEHLKSVAELAAGFASKFEAKDLGYWAGLWHDLGKVNPDFQKYLHDCEADPSRHRRGPDRKRAVICAALWPDPADEFCPASFRDKVRAEILAWMPHERQRLLGEESRKRFEKARQKPALFDDAKQLHGALLDFIADFAIWDNSTVKEYLESSRVLTQSAHEALGGAPGTRPFVVDPFAGGGSIPLEALRVGAARPDQVE